MDKIAVRGEASGDLGESQECQCYSSRMKRYKAAMARIYIGIFPAGNINQAMTERNMETRAESRIIF